MMSSAVRILLISFGFTIVGHGLASGCTAPYAIHRSASAPDLLMTAPLVSSTALPWKDPDFVLEPPPPLYFYTVVETDIYALKTERSVELIAANAPNDLRLSATRSVLTNTTLPGPDICGAPMNPQLPMELVAHVFDAAGRPVPDSPVGFFLDFALLGPCARLFGAFCTPTGTADSITVCTDASGQARARFAVTDTEMAACAVIETTCCSECGTPSEALLSCEAVVTATGVASASDWVVLEWGG